MNSTLLRTATPAWTPSCTLDALVLPAATAAPAALVIAVDAPVSQETSARKQVVASGTGHVALASAAVGYAAATPMFRTNAPQGPPSRGTPV